MDYPWLVAVKAAARLGAKKDDDERWGWVATPERPHPFDYRWEHMQQVVRNGVWLARQYPDADAEVVIAACWLHDARKGSEDHAQRGAEFAQSFLPKLDFPAAKIAAVAAAIAEHEGLYRAADDWYEGSTKPFRAASPLEPLETAILWDADKLAKIGPVAYLHFTAHQFATLTAKGKQETTQEIHERNDKWLRKFVPRTLASFNTAAAMQRGEEQMAAYLSYHAAMAQTLED